MILSDCYKADIRRIVLAFTLRFYFSKGLLVNALGLFNTITIMSFLED